MRRIINTEPKPIPTMEDFEQILGYLNGDYESRCEGVQRLRDAFQTLIEELSGYRTRERSVQTQGEERHAW